VRPVVEGSQQSGFGHHGEQFADQHVRVGDLQQVRAVVEPTGAAQPPAI